MKAVVREQRLKEIAADPAKDLETEEDVGRLFAELTEMAVEAALGAEMKHHLGYGKHAPAGRNCGNSRKGSSSKTVKGKHGEVRVTTPRDRNGTFEPKLLGKYQTRLTEFDDQILCLYAKGMTTRQIVDTFREM